MSPPICSLEDPGRSHLEGETEVLIETHAWAPASKPAGAWPPHPPSAPRASPRRPDSHRLLFLISHQAPSLQSFLQQQAQLELLARRVTLLEAIIWPGNGRAGR